MSPRIDGIVAREAPMAVVFRRGPSKLTQMLVWDLEQDEVVPGQWLGGRVYTRRCDLSPDGRYLVGAYTNYGPKRKEQWLEFPDIDPRMLSGWTAISRPPYFTALGLWFTGNAWNGGGAWTWGHQVQLNNPPGEWEWVEARPTQPPVLATLRDGARSEDEPLWSERLTRSGWRVTTRLPIEAMRMRGLRLRKESRRSRSMGDRPTRTERSIESGRHPVSAPTGWTSMLGDGWFSRIRVAFGSGRTFPMANLHGRRSQRERLHGGAASRLAREW